MPRVETSLRAWLELSHPGRCSSAVRKPSHKPNHKIECFFENQTQPRVVLCYHPPRVALSVAMPCSSVVPVRSAPAWDACPCRKEQRRHARCTGTSRRRGGLTCASSVSSNAPTGATTSIYAAIAAYSPSAAATVCASCAKGAREPAESPAASAFRPVGAGRSVDAHQGGEKGRPNAKQVIFLLASAGFRVWPASKNSLQTKMQRKRIVVQPFATNSIANDWE